MAQMIKNLPAVQETWVWLLGWEGLLEKGMATHSSVLVGRTPWTEEPGWPQLRSRLPFGPRSQASLQKAQGPGVCKLPKPPASRALCQAKRAPRAAFPSGCLAAQTKRWAEGIRVPGPLAGGGSTSARGKLRLCPASACFFLFPPPTLQPLCYCLVAKSCWTLLWPCGL